MSKFTTVIATTMAIGALVLTGCSKEKEVETVTVTEVEASAPVAASEAVVESSAPAVVEVVEVEVSAPVSASAPSAN